MSSQGSNNSSNISDFGDFNEVNSQGNIGNSQDNIGNSQGSMSSLSTNASSAQGGLPNRLTSIISPTSSRENSDPSRFLRGLPRVFSPDLPSRASSNISTSSISSVETVESSIHDLLVASKEQLDILYLQDVLPLDEINLIVTSLTSHSEQIIDVELSKLESEKSFLESGESQSSVESIESIKQEIEILNDLKQNINVYLNRFLQSVISFPLEYLDMSAAITNPEGNMTDQNLFSTLKTLCVLLKQCPFEFEINGINFSYLATLYWELLLMVVTSSGSPEKNAKRILRLEFIKLLLGCNEICDLYKLFDKACNGEQDNEFVGVFFVGGDLVVGISLLLKNAYEYYRSDFTSELSEFFQYIKENNFGNDINVFNQFIQKIGLFVGANFLNEDGSDFNEMFKSIFNSRSDFDTTFVMKKILENMRCSPDFQQEFQNKYPGFDFDDEKKVKFLYYIELLTILLTYPHLFQGDSSFFLERIKLIISALRDGSKSLTEVNQKLENLFLTAKTSYSGATEYAKKNYPNVNFFPQGIIISDVPKDDPIAYPIALDMSLKKEMIATGTKEISTAIIDRLGGNKKFQIDNLVQFISLNLKILNENTNRTFQPLVGMSNEEYNKNFVRRVFSNKDQMLTHLVPVISNSVIEIIGQNKPIIQQLHTIFTPEFMYEKGYNFNPTNEDISFYFVPSSDHSLQAKQTDFSNYIKTKLFQFRDVKNVGVTANFCEFSGSISDLDDTTNVKRILTDKNQEIHDNLMLRQQEAAATVLHQQQAQALLEQQQQQQAEAALAQQQQEQQQAQQQQQAEAALAQQQAEAALAQQQQAEAAQNTYNLRNKRFKSDNEGGSKTRKNKKNVKKFIKTKKNKKNIKKNTNKKRKNKKNIRKSRK
jgi:hypothetical protein